MSASYRGDRDRNRDRNRSRDKSRDSRDRSRDRSRGRDGYGRGRSQYDDDTSSSGSYGDLSQYDDNNRSARAGSSYRESASSASAKKKNRSAEFWVPKEEEATPPPPIVDGYAPEGMDAMPSTGINHETNQYECFVCDSPCSTESMLNAHLAGKNHIRKLEKAGFNSFLPPKPLGPIPGIAKIKDEKWRTGEKRTYSEIDPTNKGQFACTICTLEFDSRIVYETHMKGKPHARMIKWIEEIEQNDGKAHCHLCKFIATSAVHLETHFAGKKHKQRYEAAKRGLPGGTPLAQMHQKTDPDAAPKMLSPLQQSRKRQRPWAATD